MPEIKLRVDDLVLDHDNPRITHAEGQREALQKIVVDQKSKLVKLAQSIAEHGLNPMDRLLVLRVHQKPEKFISLEGNRRVAVFKLLTNPAVMSGLDMPASMRTLLERTAQRFKRTTVEPIDCFELASRQEGDYWLELRHKGENQGMGVVRWTTVAAHRFRSRSPAIQALELIIQPAIAEPIRNGESMVVQYLNEAAGSPFGETSIDPPAAAVATKTKGEWEMNRRL